MTNHSQLLLDLKVNYDFLWEESKRKYPSYYSIQGFADILYEKTKDFKPSLENVQNEMTILRHNVDIARVDLLGELKHDYDKQLKRYKPKWVSSQNLLISYYHRFKSLVEQEMMVN